MYSPGHPPHRGGNLRLGLERGKEAGTGVSLLRGGPSAESSGQGCLPPEAVRFLGQTCSEIGSQRGPQSPSPWAARGLGVPEPLPPAAPCPGLTAPPGSPTGATHPLQMNLSSSLLLPRIQQYEKSMQLLSQWFDVKLLTNYFHYYSLLCFDN